MVKKIDRQNLSFFWISIRGKKRLPWGSTFSLYIKLVCCIISTLQSQRKQGDFSTCRKWVQNTLPKPGPCKCLCLQTIRSQGKEVFAVVIYFNFAWNRERSGNLFVDTSLPHFSILSFLYCSSIIAVEKKTEISVSAFSFLLPTVFFPSIPFITFLLSHPFP